MLSVCSVGGDEAVIVLLRALAKMNRLFIAEQSKLELSVA